MLFLRIKKYHGALAKSILTINDPWLSGFPKRFPSNLQVPSSRYCSAWNFMDKKITFWKAPSSKIRSRIKGQIKNVMSFGDFFFFGWMRWKTLRNNSKSVSPFSQTFSFITRHKIIKIVDFCIFYLKFWVVYN